MSHLNSEIKVSVIVPIYNAGHYLRPALDSILDQTLCEIEVICIDDGSTDNTLELLKEYQKRDDRVRLVTENNAGPSIARNKGIVRARGEYMIFLDADDFYELDLLSTLVTLAEERSLDIAIAGYDMYHDKQSRFEKSIDGESSVGCDPEDVISGSLYPDSLFQSTTGYVWNKLFKTAFIKEKELTFAPELYVFEDVHFVMTAMAMAGRVGKTSRVLVHHRIYSNQSRPKLFKKYFDRVPLVYLKIKQFLVSRGVYVPFALSFLNVSVSRCYKIYNLLWKDAKGKFWDLLHSGGAESLGWFAHERSLFESGDVYEFAASVGLYTHAQYLKINSKNSKPNLDGINSTNLNKMIKKVKYREKIKAFFAKHRRKKKKQ